MTIRNRKPQFSRTKGSDTCTCHEMTPNDFGSWYGYFSSTWGTHRCQGQKFTSPSSFWSKGVGAQICSFLPGHQFCKGIGMGKQNCLTPRYAGAYTFSLITLHGYLFTSPASEREASHCRGVSLQVGPMMLYGDPETISPKYIVTTSEKCGPTFSAKLLGRQVSMPCGSLAWKVESDPAWSCERGTMGENQISHKSQYLSNPFMYLQCHAD